MKYIKYLFISFLIFIIIGALGSNKILNTKFINTIKNIDFLKNKIIYEDVKFNLYKFNTEVEIKNVSLDLTKDESQISDQNDFYRQIFIPSIKIKIGFFAIIKSFFSNQININKIILSEPSINISLSNKELNFLKILLELNSKFFIQMENGSLNIKNNENSINISYLDLNGDLIFEKDLNSKIKINFKQNNNQYSLDYQLKLNNSSKENDIIIKSYNLKTSLNDGDNNIEYNAIFSLKDQNFLIQNLNGQFSARGKNPKSLFDLFCIECSNNLCTKKINEKSEENENFILNAKTTLDSSKDNFFKIEDILFENNNDNSKIIGLFYYDIKKKIIYTNFLIDKLILNNNNNKLQINNNFIENLQNKWLEISDKILFINSIFKILKNNNSYNKFVIKEIILSNSFIIKNFESEFNSENKIIDIKKIHADINNDFKMKILNNSSIKNNLFQSFSLIISKDNLNFFKISSSFFENSLIIDSFEFIDFIDEKNKDNLLNLSGNIELKFNTKSNFLHGELQLNNYDFEKYKDILMGDNLFQNYQNSQTGGELIKQILFLIQKYNILYDLNIKINNFKTKSSIFKNLDIKTLIKDNKIILDLAGNNSIIKNFKINTILMFENYNPYMIIDSEFKSINFDDIKKYIFPNSIFLSEQEFKINKSETIWRNFKFNFWILKDLNSKIKINILNSEYNLNPISKISILASSEKNKLDIKNIKINIDNNSEINSSLILDLDKYLFDGEFVIGNLNYKKFFSSKNNNSDNLKNPNNTNSFISEYELSLVGKFSSSGEDLNSFIRNYNSNIKYNAYNIIFNQININNFINNYDSAKESNKLITLSEQSVIFGETKIDEIKGNISIRNNIIENNFEIFSKNFNGLGTQNMLLNNFLFKSLIRILFLSGSNYSKKVIFDLNINGNFFNINKNIDINNIKENN